MADKSLKTKAGLGATSASRLPRAGGEAKPAAGLRILCLEDDPRDHQLIVETLRTDGLAGDITHTRTRQEFQAAIGSARYDIIISDFSIPSYNGLAALNEAKNAQPETPFLFLSGTIGEELAVETLRLGATDYVHKGNWERLCPAVLRAISEAREREARNRAELSLTESEARFRQLAENIGEVFWLTDLRLKKVLYVNSAFEAVWGRTRETLYRDPRSRLDAVHDEDRARVDALTTPCLAHAVYDETYRIVRPDGVIRWVRERGYPIHNEGGEVERMVGTAEDITDQRQLQDRFRQAQKMEAIGQLAGGVAHDFNNLLTVIRGNSELVLMEPDTLSTMALESLRQVVEATQRAANLTRQLLAFSRKQVLQPQALDLNGLVENLMKMLHRIIGEHIQLMCNYSPQAVPVNADPGMLEQVIMNLVVNARDAMPEGGRLLVSTSRVTFSEDSARAHPEARAGDFACLEVTDTGTGISPENITRVFEPFFTTKAPDKGTGLGLSTVYGIAKQHLGWVEVSSRLGVGATFKVFIPANDVAPLRTEAPGAGRPQSGTETILLVEDDPAVRLMTRRTLEAYGYRIWEAASGREALKIWRTGSQDISLLLTDLIMPDGMTGNHLARVLREQKPGLKVLVMSGYTPDHPANGTEGPGASPAAFLQKPYRSSILVETVRRCLDAL